MTPVLDERGAVGSLLLIVRDIAARKRTEETVLEMEDSAWQRAILLETANCVALNILASRTGVEALHHIAEAARVLVKARYAALGVAHLDSRPGALRLREFITAGLTPEEEAVIGSRPLGHGILGLLLERTAPLRIDRLAEHPASVGFPPGHPPMGSFLGVPIRRGDVVLGSLYLTEKQDGGSFTEADEVAVQALGANAAVAIHHLHLLARQSALVRGLMTAQEEERRAVAYDLHDGLTQYVMASHAHLEAFKYADGTGQKAKAERELDQGLTYLKEAVTESRRIVNNLRLLALEDLGLAGSLEQLLNQEKTPAGWEEATFIHNISGRRFQSALEIGVYRIAQEALTNVRKHAKATRVQFLLLTEASPHIGGDASERLRLEVRDWGQGFVPEHRLYETSGETAHVGLQGIIERVFLLDGTYEVQSTPGEGTVFTASFPIPKDRDESSTRFEESPHE